MKLFKTLLSTVAITLAADSLFSQQRPPVSDLPHILVGAWRLDLSDGAKRDFQRPNYQKNVGISDEEINELRGRTYEFTDKQTYTITAEDGAVVDKGSYTINGPLLSLQGERSGSSEIGINLERPSVLNWAARSENAPLPGFSKYESYIWWKATKQAKQSKNNSPAQSATGIEPFFVFGDDGVNPDGTPDGTVPFVSGFFKIGGRDDAFYLYGIDATTGKLVEVHAVYGTQIDFDRKYQNSDEVFEQAEYNATATRNNPSGRSFLMASIAERVVDGKYEHAAIDLFNTVLPKFREWSDKAKEVKPQPFKKEIPLNRQYGRFWANFIWTQDGKPQLELFEQYRGKDGNGMVMGGETLLNEDQVEELSGALKMKDQAVLALNQLLKDAIGSAQSEQKKIQDNFN